MIHFKGKSKFFMVNNGYFVVKFSRKIVDVNLSIWKSYKVFRGDFFKVVKEDPNLSNTILKKKWKTEYFVVFRC